MSKIRRAAYVGNFGHTFTTETHIAATLQGLGVEVVELQENAVTINEIEKRANECDVLLYTRTWGMKNERGEIDHAAACAMLERLNVPSVSWHLDLYLGLPRSSGVTEGDPFWRTSFVFTPDGDSDSQTIFEARGIAHHYLRPAVFKPECYIARPSRELAAEVVFVGSGTPNGGYHPEWSYRGELITFLRDTYGKRFVKHGSATLNGGVDCLRGHALNVAYASANVVVGDTLCLGRGDARAPRFTHRGYWSDRVYETIGRGGFLIHPWIEGLDDRLKDDEHLRFYRYGDFDGLKRLIDFYLDPTNAGERSRIARAGHEHVKAHETYDNRAREVLAKVEAST
jgi:hypothetical protein